MIKAIFWDNDGVLVETEHLYFLATQRILASSGITLTEQMYIELLLVQNRGAWHLALEKGITPDEIASLRLKRDELYSQLLKTESRVVDGVKETLDKLRGRFLMGIVTSSKRSHFDVIHQSSGLLDYFDFALTREDYVHSKPHPEPYLTAINKSGFKADECVAVEDSQRGLIAAAAAGLSCIIIPNGLTAGQDFSGALRVLSAVRELPNELDLISKITFSEAAALP